MYSGIIPIIKEAAVDAVNATQPVQFVFGTVISVSPLKVQVTPKLTLFESNLVVAGSLSKKEIKFNVTGDTESVENHTHSITVTVDKDGEHQHRIVASTKSANSHSHDIDVYTSKNYSDYDGEHRHTASGSAGANGGHSHNVNIPVTVTIDNSLKKGDSVILARMQGGNQYLILDKAVKA